MAARGVCPGRSADRLCHPRSNMRRLEPLPSLRPRLLTALRLNNPSIRVWAPEEEPEAEEAEEAEAPEDCAERWIPALNRVVVEAGFRVLGNIIHIFIIYVL